jgi:hypothetical protein
MRTKELSVELRDRIVSRHRSREGYPNISAALKVPKNTVASIILKWKMFGTTKTLPRAGRPAKLSNRGRSALVREVTQNPMVTLTELQSSCVVMGEPSRRTEARQKPLLSKRHMTARLEFDKRHQDVGKVKRCEYITLHLHLSHLADALCNEVRLLFEESQTEMQRVGYS